MEYLKKMWQKLISLFKQGLTPHQLALSITISILISVFPIYGLATVIITAIALPLKLNLPIMIAVSYIAEPLKILLLLPFINIGGSLFGAEHSLLTFEAIKASYELSFLDTLKALSFELLCGSVGWAIIMIPVSILLYYILKGIITFFVRIKEQRNTI